MPNADSVRRRNRQASTARARPWVITYKERIADGLEKCRHCGSRNDLTFGHLVPHSRGGHLTFSNVTILCEPCNNEQGDAEWPHLMSLREEEAAAPANHRWAAHRGQQMQIERARRRMGDPNWLRNPD